MTVAEPQAPEAEQTVDAELGDLIVGCVRRAFDALMKDPAAKTQKGKKNVSRRLADLEDALLDMHRKAEAADKMFTELVSHMNDSLKIKRKNDAIKKLEAPSWL